MRKITRDAVKAFNEGKPFKRGNTMVRVSIFGNVRMYLHGNLIANKTGWTTAVRTAGWNSRVTRERLNGIDGCNVFMLKGQLYLNNHKWDGNLTNI